MHILHYTHYNTRIQSKQTSLVRSLAIGRNEPCTLAILTDELVPTMYSHVSYHVQQIQVISSSVLIMRYSYKGTISGNSDGAEIVAYAKILSIISD